MFSKCVLNGLDQVDIAFFVATEVSQQRSQDVLEANFVRLNERLVMLRIEYHSDYLSELRDEYLFGHCWPEPGHTTQTSVYSVCVSFLGQEPCQKIVRVSNFEFIFVIEPINQLAE
jgi:hypothetical protein